MYTVMKRCDDIRPPGQPRKKLLISSGIALLAISLFLSLERMPGRQALEALLLAQLDSPASAIQLWSGPRPEHAIIYVLGGSHVGLERKFEITGELYRRAGGLPVLLLQEPGITEYNDLLGRNLTNREWAVRSLEAQGVRKEQIETIPLPRGKLFGTLSEARMLRDQSLRRGYKEIFLVTSRYHARRTWRTFSTVFGSDRNVVLYLSEANEAANLKQLLVEYAKNLLYDVIVLPLSR